VVVAAGEVAPIMETAVTADQAEEQVRQPEHPVRELLDKEITEVVELEMEIPIFLPVVEVAQAQLEHLERRVMAAMV
jgi:hypothetical protein